ncbi:MAG TPA: DNA polymerase III subunit alpha [Trueperaceae bacterium]|nr:DNA polymerase III subunit alpha [Trueperaceae bacterium]
MRPLRRTPASRPGAPEPDPAVGGPEAALGRVRSRLSALLDTHSYFSFGGGTASPTSLVKRAAELGYRYVALTDDLNVTGGVELFQAAREHGIRALIGATVPVRLEDDVYPLVLIAASRAGYGTLCRLVSQAHERDERDVPFPVLLAHTHDLVLLTGGRDGLPARLLAQRRIGELEDALRQLGGAFQDRMYVQLFHDRYRWDERRARALRRLAQSLSLPVVSAPQVRYLNPDDYRLYDAFTCGRLGLSVQEPHGRRPQNACQYLPSPDEVASRLPFAEGALNADWVAERCHFELLPDRLVPPKARVPDGRSAEEHIVERCYAALLERYEGETLVTARQRLEKELATVRALGLADFFLVAAEVTDYCRQRGILAAGRGSAAASIVCYLLGVTQADPLKHDLLFERFLHTGKTSMPDVDIDISSARRDEVLDWVEERFGATTEAMVCNKITYRMPLAVQDLGRALGLPPELRNRLTKALGRDFRGLRPAAVEKAEVALREVLGDAPVADVFIELLGRMERKHVRHIAPHAGGVVLSRDPLTHYSPLERSSGGIKLLQLDKDDAEAMGLIKLDLLGLRMLAALERAREEVFRLEGVWLDLADLPDEERVWDLISVGATLGLFQVESPSQQHTSRVMRSRNLKDLSHQIALIRPGPIQSGTVHPYLRRRQGLEPITYWHPSLEPVLAKSYGVLLFQEDVLRIAVHFAGMSWIEADRFRKKVSGFGDLADIEPDRERFIEGARRHVSATREEAETVFDAVKGYQGFGFAESHAWAFALHAYASGWLRVHYPAEYMAAILTEEPGMWSRQTKRHEARDWGVPFLPFDVNRSGLHFRVERVTDVVGHTAERGGRASGDGQGRQSAGDEDGRLSADAAGGRKPASVKAIRPPLSGITGVSEDAARKIMLERLVHGPFRGVEDLHERVALERDVVEALVRAGAFDEVQPRREALYRTGVLANSSEPGSRPLFSVPVETPDLPRMTLPERFVWDYQTTRMSTLEVHAVDLVRDQLREIGCVPLLRLRRTPRKTQVLTAGLVVGRQRPGTAKGFAFFVIEDGPVRAQVIISPDLWDEQRVLLRDASMLVVDGIVEDTGHQLTLKAVRLAEIAGPIHVRGYHFG